MRSPNASVWRGKRLMVLPVVITLSFWFGYCWKDSAPQSGLPEMRASTAAEQADAEAPAVYVCPMMCVPPMEEAGECPVCGMELTPVHANENTGPPKLKLGPEAAKLAGIQVAAVERKPVSSEIKLYGQIEYDPAHTTKINAFMPGVIDRVYVKRSGQFVRWGDPLFDIYSPDLRQTQQQLIEAIKYVPTFLAFQSSLPHTARDMPIQELEAIGKSEERTSEEKAALRTIAAVRHKLSILGLPKRDIDELMKSGEATGVATVYASSYGQVIDQSAFEGAYVNTGTVIFTISDPLFVWVKLQAYEMDYAWIRNGQEVTFQADAYPGETFKAKIHWIDPVFDVKTRTFGIGAISTEDHGGRLKSGMVVRAVVHARLSEDGKVAGGSAPADNAPLVVPASAPLLTGKRAVVYVAVPGEDALYEGREVILGPKAKDYYVVTAGLQEGERVVVNGNFKIDSAVQILAGQSMMSIEGGHSAVEHNHHGGSGRMHENYWSERMRMRSESMTETEHEGRDSAQGPHRGRAGDAPVSGRSVIQRRKPGMYGDTVGHTERSRGRLYDE